MFYLTIIYVDMIMFTVLTTIIVQNVMCLNVLVKGLSVTVMSGSAAMVMRLVASAYCVAEKAGSIVRRVLHSGDLGIVDKVTVEPFVHTACQL